MINTPDTLIVRIDDIGMPRPIREFEFTVDRKWRFDFAWPHVRVAIEIEGGVSKYKPGRHLRAEGFQGDLDKYNIGSAYGWRIFRFSSKDIQENRGPFVASLLYIKSVLMANRSL